MKESSVAKHPVAPSALPQTNTLFFTPWNAPRTFVGVVYNALRPSSLYLTIHSYGAEWYEDTFSLAHG